MFESIQPGSARHVMLFLGSVARGDVPEWQGPLDRFFADNDSLDEQDRADIVRDLREAGRHLGGGGAAGGWLLCTPAYYGEALS